MIRFIDLFAGVGGFHLGLERANNIEEAQSKRDKESREDISDFDGEPSAQRRSKPAFNCVWANEWDKYAGEIYKKRFPKTKFFKGDIRTIDPERLPRFDLLCGGFPCQSFSIAGKRRGFADERGKLINEIFKIIKTKRPKVVLLENVKGLLSSGCEVGTGIYKKIKGKSKGEITTDLRTIEKEPKGSWEEVTVNVARGFTFTQILLSLQELGYDFIEYEMLNSKNFGVPQNRERVFIIGHSRKGSCGQIFPLGQTSEEPEQRFSETEVASSLQHPGHSGGNYRGMNMISKTIRKGGRGSLTKKHAWDLVQVGTIGEDSEATRVYDSKGIARTIKDGGGMGAKTGLYMLPNATKEGYAIANEGDGVRLQHLNSKTARGRVIKQKAQTLQTSGLGGTIQRSRIRRLTPRECERLQGFPDDWTLIEQDNRKLMSDTQRYKMMGNAVTVNVIQSIGEKLKEALE